MAGRIPKVVVLGPIYVDMAMRCSRFPQPGQTTEGSGFACIPTGAGTISAVQAAVCGCDVHLLGKVGNDVFGTMVCESLARYGVNADFVYRAPAISTGIIMTLVDEVGENSSCVSQGANRALSADEVGCVLAEQLIGAADVCLVCAGIDPEVAAVAIRAGQLNRTRVILEVGIQLDEAGTLMPTDWPKEYVLADVLLPRVETAVSRTESSPGTVSEMKYVGTELVAEGFNCVALRMGSRGTLVVDRDGPVRVVDPEPCPQVDRTAREEAFAGAFAAAIGAQDPPVRAAKFGAAAASLACRQIGSLEALPKKAEIIELLQSEPD